jgi:hypothetical protein
MQDGDFVIRMRRQSATVFVVGRHNEPPQVSWKSYQEALERTLSAAERAQVNVWYSLDGVTFDCIAAFRPGTK